jgi:V/A-type H+/Na+-transporting ATPase subunit D
MALKVQYNKTAIQQLQKQLTIREKALPTLKSKETALRLEVKKAADKLNQLKAKLEDLLKTIEDLERLWVEFPEVLSIEKKDIFSKNIAGVRIPILKEVKFKIAEINLAQQPAWVPMGIELLKEILKLRVEMNAVEQQFEILTYARKKTTQKVNLYEKVQIPQYREAIRKIKRFLEDKENLEKAAQKIVKQRNEEKEVAV